MTLKSKYIYRIKKHLKMINVSFKGVLRFLALLWVYDFHSTPGSFNVDVDIHKGPVWIEIYFKLFENVQTLSIE